MAGDRRRQRDYDGDYYVDGGLLFSVSSLAASNIVPAAASHSWAKHKKLTGNEIQKNREIYSLYLCLQQFNKFWISRPCNDRKRKLCMWICRNLLGKTREITSSELIFGEFFRCAAASITSVAGAGSSKRNDERGHPMRVYSVNDHSSLRGYMVKPSTDSTCT